MTEDEQGNEALVLLRYPMTSTERTSRKIGKRELLVLVPAVAASCALIVFAGLFVYKSVSDAESQSRLDENFRLGEAAYLQNDLPKAEEYFVNAAKAARKKSGDSSHEYLNTLQKLEWVYQEEGKYSDARKLLAKMNRWNAAKVMQFKEAQTLAYALAPRIDSIGKSDEAVDQAKLQGKLRVGLAALAPFLKDDDPGLIKPLERLEQCSIKVNDYQSAEEALARIAAIRSATHGSTSMLVARNQLALADVYISWANHLMTRRMLYESGKLFDQARKNYAQAMTALKGAGPDCPDLDSIREKMLQCEKQLQSLPKDFPALTASAVAVKTGQLPPFEP